MDVLLLKTGNYRWRKLQMDVLLLFLYYFIADGCLLGFAPAYSNRRDLATGLI